MGSYVTRVPVRLRYVILGHWFVSAIMSLFRTLSVAKLILLIFSVRYVHTYVTDCLHRSAPTNMMSSRNASLSMIILIVSYLRNICFGCSPPRIGLTRLNDDPRVECWRCCSATVVSPSLGLILGGF